VGYKVEPEVSLLPPNPPNNLVTKSQSRSRQNDRLFRYMYTLMRYGGHNTPRNVVEAMLLPKMVCRRISDALR